MNGTKWYASPLAGTAAVLSGLCLLAIPLRKLTSAEPISQVKPAAIADSTSNTIPAVLRLRLLAAARQVTVETSAGKMLLDLKNPEAGETEHDLVIPFDDGCTDLTVSADFAESANDTAVFLTLMPDGFEDQTRHAIGNGSFNETLHFEWHIH